jgi:multidrug efflux pump
MVRLRDVASLELGVTGHGNRASWDGKPCVALAIFSTPGTRPANLRAAVHSKMELLRSHYPQGVDDLIVDFTPEQRNAVECLRLDVALPAGASQERSQSTVERSAALARAQPGVQHVLSLAGPSLGFADNRACALVCLDTNRRQSRAEVAQSIRGAFGESPGATVRLCDVSDRCTLNGYPLDLAIYGPDGEEVRKLGEKLAERLKNNDKLSDLWTSGSKSEQQLAIDIDREKAMALGISVDDIFTTLHAHLGTLHVNHFHRFGRTWQVLASFDAGSMQVEELKVRNKEGDLIRLGSVLSVRTATGLSVVYRFDLRPMVRITANPAGGVSLEDGRALCESEAATVRQELGLPATYRWNWIQD